MNAKEPSTPIDWDRYTAELATDTVAADLDGAPVLVDTEPATAEAISTSETRSIIPEWCRSKASIAAEIKRAIKLRLHTLGYHAVRLPLYAMRLLASAPRGVARVVGGLTRWASDEEGRIPRADTIAKHDYEGYRKLVAVRDRHVRWRGICLALLGIPTIGVAITLVSIGGPIMWGSLAALTAVFGFAGRPEDKPVTDTAVVKTELKPLTANVVKRALTVIGLAGINKAPDEINFVAPITREGPGWRADLDLPYGVTAGEVAEKRDKLASGLSRPVGCVWPESRPDIHPGRLVLWVGDQDMATAKQPAWPLAKRSKPVNLFEPFPVGTDPRGNAVVITLMYVAAVIGAIPRMGKTFLLRLILLAAALDPRSEIHSYDLKGTGDLKPLARVSHSYRAGDEDEDMEYLMADIRQVHKELRRRTKAINDLPSKLCPENKVTDELASKKSLGLHPIIIGIDECQRLFEHDSHGDEAEAICEDLVKRGPATGIVIILATQRPDKDSLPTGIRANAVMRFCFKVTGQLENDMVLGTSMYKKGVNATEFSFKDKGIAYLVGEGDEPGVLKSHFIDSPGAEAITNRAYAIREAEGRLTGYAAGETTSETTATRHDLLADLVAAWPAGETAAWNADLVDHLADLKPDAYHSWAELDDEDKGAALTRALRGLNAAGLVKQVGRRYGGKIVNRRGISHDTLTKKVTDSNYKAGS